LKTYVCFLGIIIVVVSLFIMAQSTLTYRTVENEKWREWRVREIYKGIDENDTAGEIGPEPPYYIHIDERHYPYTTLGAIIFLIGFVTLVIGFAIPEDR